MPLVVFGKAKIQWTQVFTIYLFAFSGIYIGESVPLVVFGMAKIQRVQMLAELSGLKLEAELRKVHATGTYKKKVKGAYVNAVSTVEIRLFFPLKQGRAMCWGVNNNNILD